MMSSNQNDPEEPTPYREPPELQGFHLLTHRTFWFDNRRPEAGFSIAGIYTHIEPPEGFSFPFRLDRVFVYFQLWGDPGIYRPRIRLVRVSITDDDEEEEIHLGTAGEPREFPMPPPHLVEITGLNYVDEVAFPIGPVPFREAGLYEFQLWADGVGSPIARERVLARE